MVKLIKTIVNENRMLIGFVVEGKDRELDGFSDSKVTRQIPLSNLANKNFSNNQIAITAKGVKEKGNFKINDLPMCVLVGSDFIDVDNGISITKRYIQENEPIGFAVQFADSTKDNFRYASLIQLSNWFKPVNFMVRTSASGKKFISGKPGVMKLEELPVVYVGDRNAQNEPHPSKIKSGAQPKEQFTGKFNNALDIMDIYDFVRKCDGLIIKLPNEEYKLNGPKKAEIDASFKPLGVGEFAQPYLKFGETKLNVNTTFRKPGVVSVKFSPGAETNIQTFTYSTKNIFFNGDTHMKKFGVAIPKSIEEEFNKVFGKTLSMKPITDMNMIQSISALAIRADLVFYEVDTNKVDIINEAKFSQYILPPANVKVLMEEMYAPKLITKYLSQTHGLIAELKKNTVVSPQEVLGKQPVGFYSGMNPEFRQKITDAGIDIYTGAFNKRTAVDKEDSKSDSAEDKEECEIGIQYSIEGQDLKKLTYSKIVQMARSEPGTLPKEVEQTVLHFDSIQDNETKIKEAYAELEKADKRVEDIKRKLWLHKCSMYLKGNKVGVHSDDKSDWVLNTKSRAKSKVYNCIVPGCEGLMIAVENVDIA